MCWALCVLILMQRISKDSSSIAAEAQKGKQTPRCPQGLSAQGLLTPAPASKLFCVIPSPQGWIYYLKLDEGLS